jgi:hypothetical protein
VFVCTIQRSHIERTAKSTSGVNNLNAEELRALLLRLPSLAEQAEIVRRVDAFFKLADRIEARYKPLVPRPSALPRYCWPKPFAASWYRKIPIIIWPICCQSASMH